MSRILEIVYSNKLRDTIILIYYYTSIMLFDIEVIDIISRKAIFIYF